jgi:hypothetical protein
MQTNKLTLSSQLGTISIDGDRRKFQARFVRAGHVLLADGTQSNIVVSAEALSRAVERGLFNQRAVFVDHAGWFENQSLRDIAGNTQNAIFTGDAVEGEIELYNTSTGEEIATLLDEILDQGQKAPNVGLSIVFYPVWKHEESRGDANGSPSSLHTVVDIKAVESVDLVFQPAADGRILAALSAANVQYMTSKEEDQTMEETVSPTPETPVGADGIRPNDGIRQTFGEEWQRTLRDTVTQGMIANSNLPAASQTRLIAELSRDNVSPKDVIAAVETERKYLAALQESQTIQLGGQPPRAGRISGMLDSLDKMGLAMEALVGGVRPEGDIQPLSGIREAYHLLSGDYEMSGMFHPDRIMFANVNSSTMAALVANALNKRLINEFQSYPQWWTPIVTTEDFASLQTVRWITLGGVGELPTVAEGAAYTELTWDDKTETASFVKKGGYLGITLEAIDKDDVGRLRAAPRALAQAAWLTLSKAVSYIFTQSSGVGPTMSDSVALFDAAHSNVGSTALSRATYVTARLAMRKQTELNSGERLGALTAPKYILVPPDLELTALEILASESDYTYALSNGTGPGPANALAEGDSFQARMVFARSRVIVVDLWTDTNDWACVADPRLYPSIGLGYRYGRTPEIFSVASPTAGLMFTNDTMPIKARFFFAVGPTDYKGLYKANVT